jgi:hypothetical protein
MLGINYESSDDEEEVVAPPIPQVRIRTSAEGLDSY